MKALIKAGETIVVAGHPDDAPDSGILGIYSARNGSLLSRIRLPAAPIYDGMAAANDRLFISTRDGKVLCFGKK